MGRIDGLYCRHRQTNPLPGNQPFLCTMDKGHEGDHGYGGVFWPPVRKKWEYNTVSVKDDNTINLLVLLDEAGEEGWEFTGHVTDTGWAQDYLMKREWIE